MLYLKCLAGRDRKAGTTAGLAEIRLVSAPAGVGRSIYRQLHSVREPLIKSEGPAAHGGAGIFKSLR